MNSQEEQDHPLSRRRVNGARQQTVIPRRRQPPARALEDQPWLTYGLIAVNTLIFLAGFLIQELELELLLRGALMPELVVARGEFYRLLTAMFLHGSLGHIFFNAYATYIVGRNLEPIFGRVRYLLIYFLGGLTGSAASLALGGLATWSVGASGAVFAIFAAEAAHLYQHRWLYPNVRARLQHMLVLIVINLVIGFAPGSRIDNWGHIGGMIGGLLLAWRMGPRLSRPTAPVRSMREFAKTDSNPLSLHLPAIVIYIGALIAVVVLVVNLFSAQL
ncbi:MAG: rhomboid family intramembrane serine protease [Chloroflexota bacterium]|nr:rhomboid family intramembrane serine protease [Chloroflexota bacterium]MDE2908586.1 rhomboid family intramembrane serine protease [Chloroflexota bacterium]